MSNLGITTYRVGQAVTFEGRPAVVLKATAPSVGRCFEMTTSPGDAEFDRLHWHGPYPCDDPHTD